MALVLKNNASSTLAGSILVGATTISVQVGDASKFPALGVDQWHPITVVDGGGNLEIMRVTGRSGAVLTVVRAQEGTAAFAFADGASVQLRLTAGAMIEALGLKADSSSPVFGDKVIIHGNVPALQLRDANNAGAGKNYFWELDSDILSLFRDANADGDHADGTETTALIRIEGAAGKTTLAHDLVAKSLRWIQNTGVSSTDLNALVASGFYIGDTFTNSPDGSTGRFYVSVQRGADDNNVHQSAVSYASAIPRTFSRSRVAGTWGKWHVHAAMPLDTTMVDGQLLIGAIDHLGAPVAAGVIIHEDMGSDLMAAATAAAARDAMLIGTGNAAAFARVHGGGDNVTYNFGSDVHECAFLNSNTLKVSSNGSAAMQLQRIGSNGGIATFYRGTSAVGDISVTGAATSYNTSSDHRLKYDVESLVSFSLDEEAFDFLPDTLRRLMATRPISHRWIGIDGADSVLTHGFIAHELQQVLPTAVTGDKDEMEDVGSADMGAEPELHGVTYHEAMGAGAAAWSKTGTQPRFQSVDHSKLVPDLVAGMQELTLLLLEQRSQIAALEQRLAERGV